MKAQKYLVLAAIAILINAQGAIAQVDSDKCHRGSDRRSCQTSQPFCKQGEDPKKDNCRPLIFLPE